MTIYLMISLPIIPYIRINILYMYSSGQLYIHVLTHIHIHAYTHTDIQTYIHTYIHTHIHTYTHTYIRCIYMLVLARKSPYIRSYTAYMHSSGQPQSCCVALSLCPIYEHDVTGAV